MTDVGGLFLPGYAGSIRQMPLLRVEILDVLTLTEKACHVVVFAEVADVLSRGR
jgi:hypothetical protein